MCKRRILYIHHGKGIGGAPISLLYLIGGLDKSRYEPIVCFLQPTPVMERYRKAGITVIGPLMLQDQPHSVIRWYRWYHPHLRWQAWKDANNTIKHVAPQLYRQVKPDLVHLNTSSLQAWAQVARSCGIPVVWHIRESIADGYVGYRKHQLVNAVQKHADAIVAISSNDAIPWQHSGKLYLVHNPVDTRDFDPVRVQTSPAYSDFVQAHHTNTRPTILFLGGLSQTKGTHIILAALTQLLKRLPTVQLLIAGYFDGATVPWYHPRYSVPAEWYKRAVFRQWQQVRHAVRLLGPIQQVPAAMLASDVVVFPATVGHFARPVIEAGFMGRPVVASSLAPLPELLKHGSGGYLVDPNDIPAWTQAIYELLTDNMLRISMGNLGQEYARARFDFRLQAQKVQRVYDQVLAAKN